ncbi:MAG: DUF535 family protein [Rhodospirillaceae bacterium]
MVFASIAKKFPLVLSYTRLAHDQHKAGGLLGGAQLVRGAKFLGRSLIWWSDTTRWLELLETLPLAGIPPVVRKEMAEKIHRPYARLNLGTAGRTALLIGHYTILSAALPGPVLEALVSGTPLPLARLQGRRSPDDRYTIQLTRHRRFHQQGEVVIVLFDETLDRALSTLCINLRLDPDGRRVLFISGLQGPSLPIGKTEIVHATRSLDGLRPKRAVLEATYALARWLKIDAIVAISKANHMSTGLGRRWRDIRAEYDEFWAEFEPVLLADGDFGLPAALPQRNISEVAAKRRKDWINRNARLDAITADVTAALEALAAS